uniref:Apple domain-containing protein n=1 Tax=Alexandrium catenella TaxID=2925 RepID=A0A7S1WLI3_ALECA
MGAPPPYWSMEAAKDTACRGLFHFDNSNHHYVMGKSRDTLESCQEQCQIHPNCTGIEYSAVYGQRCEIWTRPYGIGATVPKRDFVCLRYSAPRRSPLDFARRGPWVDCEREPCYEWSLVDGGEDRACRGANTTDDEDSYYILHEATPTIDACLAICNDMNAACSTSICQQRCSGVEYHPAFNDGRCEAWTRPPRTDLLTGVYHAGVGASAVKDGFVCMRFQAVGSWARYLHY